MVSVSPWLVLAGLGAFHGLNPAMGWLFAVALGLHRKSRRIVLLSLIPIATGHMVSIGVVAAMVVALGLVVDQRLLEIAAGMVLLGWAAYSCRIRPSPSRSGRHDNGHAGARGLVVPDGDSPWGRPHAGAGAHTAVPRGNSGRQN